MLFGALLLFVGLGLAPPAAEAQEGARITGRVSEVGTGAPLSDVQVYLVDTGLGVNSRQTGTYVIVNVPPGTYELRAERIGLTNVSREITVTAGDVLQEDFELEDAALGLDEIVVTGTAGAARRREVGNSITQINTVDLPERPTSVMDMLQSMAPGVEVSNFAGGGELGQGSNITIRGQNSINNNTPPIIFIDGVRMMSDNFSTTTTPDIHSNGSNNRPSPLDQLNPNDIERIEIISGPAASTLYGTEASAGVIQVFTRQGSTTAPQWNAEVQGSTLWSEPFGPEGFPYLGLSPWVCSGPFNCGEFMDVPISQNYALSVRGGAQALQYFISAGADMQEGSTRNDLLDRWNVRGNFTVNPMEDVIFQWNTAYTNTSQQNTPSGNNASGLALNVYRGNQGYVGSEDPEVLNTILDWEITQEIERFTSGGTLTYTPLANLTNRVTIGYDFTQQESRNMRPFGFRTFPQGGLDIQVYTRRYLSFDYAGTYSFDVMDQIRSSFSWGGQAVGDFSSRVEAWGESFPGAAKPTVNSASSTLGYEERETVWNSGFFFQNVFDITNRYFLTLGLRVDGNSTFGKNFNLAMYPKVSGSWVLSDEGYWNPDFGTLKLRGAWGKSGRAPDAFVAQRTWENTGLAGQPAFTPDNLGNPDIGPEVTTEIEVGFDATWFNDRVRPRYTYYRQVTDDAIQDQDAIPSLGFTSDVDYNIGKVANWGHEIAVDFTAFRGRDWGLDVGTNFSRNQSEVLEWEGLAAGSSRIGRPISYRTWDMWHNPEGMGTSLHSASGTYSAQTCLVDAEDEDGNEILDENDENIEVWRPGLDPSIHACRWDSEDVYGYPLQRPNLAGLTATLRMPYGIQLSTRADYSGGGAWTSTNAMGSAIGRNVPAPICLPYYENKELNQYGRLESNQLRPDTPGIWARRCRNGSGYDHPGDRIALRTVSATVPMDFAFPDRVQNAILTLVLQDAWTWRRGSLYGNYESSGERVPPATSIRASLRVTF